MLWFGQITGVPTKNSGVPLIASYGTFRNWGLSRFTTGTSLSIVRSNSLLSFSNAFTSGTSGFYGVVGTVLSGGSARAFVNGNLIGSTSASSFSQTYSSNLTYVVNDATIEADSTSAFSLGALWSRQLSPGESALTSSDPTNFLLFPGDLTRAFLGARAPVANALGLASSISVPASMLFRDAKTLPVAATAPASLTRQTGLPIASGVSAPASLLRQTGEVLSVAVSAAVTLMRQIAAQFPVAGNLVAGLARETAELLSIAASAAASLSATPLISRTLAATVAATASLTRATGLAAAAVVASIASAASGKGLFLQVAASVLPRVSWVPSRLRVAANAARSVLRVRPASQATRIAVVTMASPQPIPLDDMRQSTTDSRGMDLSKVLSVENDTIVNISGVTVARVDGQSLGAEDLTITPGGYSAPFITANAAGLPATQVNWWQQVGAVAAAANVGYVVTVAYQTAAGRDLESDGFQLVTQTIG